jgi:hypothetical protein
MRASGRLVTFAFLATVMGLMAASPSTAEAGPDPKRGVAVLEYRAGSPALAAVDRRVAAILRKKTSLGVIDAEDARRRYGRNLDRKVVQCSGDAGCIAKIGKKLGAAEVVLIGVSQFGDVILTLQRIDVAGGRVVMRVAEAMAQGAEPGDAELVRYLQRVLPKSDFLRFGVIRIDANIAGAAVVIGGKQRGTTPLAPVRVKAPASYDILLKKSGYLPFRATVAVPPDAEVKVEPVLAVKSRDAWYKRWWVLAIAGAAVAGAAAAVVMTRDADNDLPVVIQPF